MPSLDVFNSDAFSVQSLSAAINETPYVPGRIGQLGLFSEQGISTTSMMVEQHAETLALVTATQRGAFGDAVGSDKRKMRSFPAIHLQTNATILADEVQNIRSFGTESTQQTVQEIVNQRLAKMRRNLDATLEYQRIGAIKGTILDADGSTTLLDIFSEFGLTQDTVDFEMDVATTDVRTKVMAAIRLAELQLGGTMESGFRAFCSDTFWDALISHDDVKDAYSRWMDGDWLRQDPRSAFPFAGVQWERYRGSVSGNAYVEANYAYLVPEGVPDMFITRFAPADYTETVNTMGIPYYSRQEAMPMNKGIILEGQSNPITLCTRPKAVIKLLRY